MNKYFEIIGIDIDGDKETLYGSFNKEDSIYEFISEKRNWKEEGYKNLKIIERMIDEEIDYSVYPEMKKKFEIIPFIKEKNEEIYIIIIEKNMIHKGEIIFLSSSTFSSLLNLEKGKKILKEMKEDFDKNKSGNISSEGISEDEIYLNYSDDISFQDIYIIRKLEDYVNE